MFLTKTLKTTIHPRRRVRERKNLNPAVADASMKGMTRTSHPQRTVGSKRPLRDSPVVTIGAKGTMTAMMTDMEEVAGILAIELVIEARAGAGVEVATGPALQRW